MRFFKQFLSDWMIALGLGALVAAPLLILWFGYRSFVISTEDFETARADHAWLTNVLKTSGPALTAQASSSVRPAQSPLTLADIQQSVRAADLDEALTSLVAQGEAGPINLRFDNAPFETISRWISSLERAGRITLARLVMTSGSAPGLVRLDMTLEAAP